MKAILINVFFYGRSENLETGWKEDKNEIYDMAVWNLMRSSDCFVFGDGWKQNLQSKNPCSFAQLIKRLAIHSGKFYFDHSEKIHFSEPYGKGVGWVRSWLQHTGAVFSDIDSIQSISEMHFPRAMISTQCGKILYLIQLGKPETCIWFFLSAVVSSETEDSFEDRSFLWAKPGCGRVRDNLLISISKADELSIQEVVQQELGEELVVTNVQFINPQDHDCLIGIGVFYFLIALIYF